MKFFFHIISSFGFFILASDLFSVSADVNNTYQIYFLNETWNENYSNSSTEEYKNKTTIFQLNLEKVLINMTINSIRITSLNISGSSLIATTFISSNETIDIQRLNNALANIYAMIPTNTSSSTIQPDSTSTSPSTNSVSITTLTDTSSVSTVSPLTGNTTFSSNTNSINTNANFSISFSTSTQSFVNDTNFTVPFNSSSPVTASSNFTLNSSPTTTSDSQTNATNSSSTMPNTSIFPTTLSSSNPIPTNNVTYNFSSITTSNSLQTNSIISTTSSLTDPNTSIPSTTSGSTNPVTTTSSLPSISTTSSTTTTPSITPSFYTVTSQIPLTTASPKKNLTIRFENEVWIKDYSDSNSDKYKEKVQDLYAKLADAFTRPITDFVIYSLREGSIIIVFGLPNNINDNQIATALVKLVATIINDSTGLPIYAIVLITVFSFLVAIAIAIVLTAVICRQKRLKGYGKHQVDFFEMENGWKYSNRNSSYQGE